MRQECLIGKTRNQLAELLKEFDPLPFRADQLFEAIYRRRTYDIDRMTNLPMVLRTKLAKEYVITDIEIQEVFASTDGTRRYLLRLGDGTMIESVWIPEPYADTLCLSTQAGCPLRCAFCMTGKLGLTRNLEAGEIVSQVGLVLNHLYGVGAKPNRRVNIVLMGMGEPLLNYENTLSAVRLLCDPHGMGISPRRITLSTVGIVPRIPDLAREPIRPELAVSLSATTNELRDQLIPVNKQWPIEELLAVCRRYPLRTNERISFEYVMLDRMNDTEEDANRLTRLLQGMRAKVNLIPHNPSPELPFKSSPQDRILRFQQILRGARLQAFIRTPRGQDINAACGQLTARRKITPSPPKRPN